MPIANLLQKFPIISDQISQESLEVMLGELEKVVAQGIPGDVVEFGCYIGTTSLFIRRLLNEAGQSAMRSFHAYDSFEGLPQKSSRDLSAAGVDFKAGELQVSKKQFLREFQKAGLLPPKTHKRWFGELQPHDVPSQIAFGFLDGDFYDSILQSLRLVWPRLASGGAVAIDDYGRETLPGVQRAVADFFQTAMPTLRLEHGIAVMHRP